MNCKKCSELMSLYIDNQLDSNEMILFEEHLNICKECLKEYNELMIIVNNLNTLDEELPENFHSELMEKIDEVDSIQKNKRIFKGIFNFRYLSPVAAFVCIIFIIYSNNINNISSDLNTKVEDKQINSESPGITYFSNELDSSINSNELDSSINNDKVDRDINSPKVTRASEKTQIESIPQNKLEPNVTFSEQFLSNNEEKDSVFKQIELELKNKYNLDKEVILINLDNINKEDKEWIKEFINNYNGNIKVEDELIEEDSLEAVSLKINSINYSDIIKIGIDVNLGHSVHKAEIQLMNTDNGYNILIIDED